jgi:hypothetical protein
MYPKHTEMSSSQNGLFFAFQCELLASSKNNFTLDTSANYIYYIYYTEVPNTADSMEEANDGRSTTAHHDGTDRRAAA